MSIWQVVKMAALNVVLTFALYGCVVETMNHIGATP